MGIEQGQDPIGAGDQDIIRQENLSKEEARK